MNNICKIGYEVQFPEEFPEKKPKLRDFILCKDNELDLENLIDILEKCLEVDSIKRIKAGELLKHRYFSEYVHNH